MAKWSDISPKLQSAVIVVVAVAITAGLYFMVYKPTDDSNRADLQTLAQKNADLAQLRPYEGKLADLGRQIENLKQQLELQKRIVPDEKDAEAFITMVQREGSNAGIEIRRYSSKPPARMSSIRKCRTRWRSTALILRYSTSSSALRS